MYKCWNCGTEHELPASDDAFERGQLAVLRRIKRRLAQEMCGLDCDLCEGIQLAVTIINDEFGLYDESSA